jgi:hypothetical protein
MVDVQTVSIVVASASVVVGVIYYALQLRNQNRMRQVDLVMRLNTVWVGSDFLKAYATVMDRDVKEYETASLGNFSKWIPEMQIGVFFNDVAFLVHKGLADLEVVDTLFPVVAAWEKLEPLVAKLREFRNDPTYYGWLEYLYNELKKRE